MFSQTLLAFLLWVQLCSSNILTCFYQYDDSLLQIDYSRPQQKTIKIKSNLIENNAKGFGFWSKYIAIMDFDSFTQFTRPCDQQYEFMGQCIFNGFFFMKILDQNQDNVAAVILNMKDEPISLTHEIYLFAVGPNEYQQAKFNFEASRYQNTWYYTSIVYQDIDHKLRIFTNFEYQVQSFDYQIMTDEITILLGGYDQQLYNNYVFDGYQLLFFKGYFSPIQEYDEFGYSNDFFQGLFTQCLFQEQLTYTKIYDENAIIDPSQQQSDDFSTLSYQYQIVNNRYLVKCWVKQDYQEAFQYYLNQYDRTYLQLRQTLFHIDSLRYFLQELQGDRLLDLYYEVDFENNKETIIKISSEFIKIPVLIAQYSDENLRQYDTVIVRKDNLYELTQQWHYIIIEYGRKPVNGAIFQIQFVFLNEEHLIYNLGTQDYNTQLLGSNIIQHILRQDDNYIKSRTKIRHLKFITGYHEDNNQSELECHSSCNGCFGPMNYQCKSCYLEFNYELTSLNVCDCKYLTSFVQELQKCKPIEDFEYLQISQEKSQILCNFGYFQAKHNNEIYCIQCPEYQKERLLCGDCYHYSTTWYLKPVCTFDYIQQSAEYPFIKIVRQNIHYDVYYLDDLIQLQLLQGAADFCDDTQEDCQVSQNYHLGQQIRMKCKKNHFFENNQCQICDPYCIDCQSKDICINCIETHYFNALSQKCEFCPQECLTCTRDNNTETGYRCLTCSKFHALTQDGRCQQCGFDCEYCREDYNIIAQQYFMRCLKCTDQKVMAIRFDGINCRVIIIQNCQYVMLVSRANIWAYSTYDYNFEPKNDIDDEFPICGQCENGYGYNFYEELCEPRFYDANCVQSFFTQMLYNGAIYDYQQFCLISNYYSGPATQGDECTSQIANCKLCYNPSQFQPSFFCIECKQGYYSNHSTGQCSVCAESLNCNTCYNSIKEFNDSWKLNLQAFNQFLKQQYNQQYFVFQSFYTNSLPRMRAVILKTINQYVLHVRLALSCRMENALSIVIQTVKIVNTQMDNIIVITVGGIITTIY